MTIDLSNPDIVVREHRLGSITGYAGSLKEMTLQGCSGCLTNRKRCFTNISSCTHYHCLALLINIEDAVVVDHAPLGCTSGIINFTIMRNCIVSFVPTYDHARVISSNLRESDTIFGGLEKLRTAIRVAYERYQPKIIYVSTSCTSSIIGDDTYSVVEEMREELGIEIGFAAVEGIKSKIWASGFDAYGHAVVDTVIRPPEKKEKLVNYLAFGDIGREPVDELFGRLGYEVLYITGKTTNEEYARASQAVASFGQCGAQSSYLAGALEQLFGVRYFQTHLPYGGIGFERFLREIAPFLGAEELAEQIIAEERAKYLPEVARLKKKLEGKTAVIMLGASYAYEYTRILRELGIKVLHSVSYHYDPHLDNQSEDIIAAAKDARDFEDVPTSVNDIQALENYLVVQKYRPDFVISRAHGDGPMAVRTGIPDIEGRIGLMIFGYGGLVSFGRIVEEELENTNFVRKLSEHYISPFTEEYESWEPFSFLEEEAV